ncbi:methylglyoxal synthase [Siculibacillus lacustris]|uniref:Methylglyoxal synthase n=1 Tax=Siculibacillus lacustris TaxID=1549641 RepID=A0A4Q9VFC4_9HYPH|nr:methylglyoxal synthase [Siculibacillus lacustris]TBW33007.1 methylglyoxal synthase [Siculibacillus lacustris]
MPMTIAVIAHDEKKALLAEWAHRNAAALVPHRLIGTATTGAMIRKACPELHLETVKSGPLGGDLQIGAMIAEGAIDLMIFFPDPLTSMPHDVDVKALLRIALVYDVPCAFNQATADLIVGSGLLDRHLTETTDA